MGKSDPNTSPSQLRDRDGATVPAALGVVLGVNSSPQNPSLLLEYREGSSRDALGSPPGMDPT